MSSIPPSAPTGHASARPPTLRLGLASALALWLAQPPVGWWPLAWVAPIGWLMIARRGAPLDRGDWLRVYASGCVYWLLAVHWIRLPHPMTSLGWPLLAMYLACYPTAFVWLTRGGVRWGVPLWFAAPVVWTGLEYLQAHLFSGFLMGAVSHSQAGQIWLISIAQIVGAYGVSAMLLLFASVCVDFFPFARGMPGGRFSSRRSVIAGVLFLAILLLGVNLFAPFATARRHGEPIRVALIQGNTLATWDADPDRSRKIMDRQTALTLDAARRAEADGIGLDLVVWPESMFRPPLSTFDGRLTPPQDLPAELKDVNRNARDWFASLAETVRAPLLVGIDHYDWRLDRLDDEGRPETLPYNSAALVDESGEPVAVYDKTHLVPFGEYIPLAEGAPALYYLTPMEGGLRPGAGPMAMPIPTRDGGRVILSASVCYETVVPHVIRRQVAELTDRGETPGLLVNITNDAWFWGSSELDMHLGCAVFRAVETGTPIVIAANGGLSAAIDPVGRVRAVSRRMSEQALVVDVPTRRAATKVTPYVRHGDWFALGCLLAAGVLAILQFLPAASSRAPRTPPPPPPPA